MEYMPHYIEPHLCKALRLEAQEVSCALLLSQLYIASRQLNNLLLRSTRFYEGRV